MSRRHRKGRSVHGILLLDKPSGGSSNHALQHVKRLFSARKAGHTGSLDPLATGMLPICFGEATKLSAFLLDADKGYETTLQLGVSTTSADSDGEVIQRRPVPESLTLEVLTELCMRFTGPQQQIPPMVSAIKIGGQRLYKLAREGRDVKRPARAVTVHELQVLSFSGTSARLAVRCSKGTYIRSLVTDIGEAIGCGAHVTALRRTFVSPFRQHAMISTELLERIAAVVHSAAPAGAGTMPAGSFSGLDELLLPVDAGLGHLPAVTVDDAGLASFQRGQSAPLTSCREEAMAVNRELPCRVYDIRGRLAGLGEVVESGELVAPRRVLQWD